MTFPVQIWSLFNQIHELERLRRLENMRRDRRRYIFILVKSFVNPARLYVNFTVSWLYESRCEVWPGRTDIEVLQRKIPNSALFYFSPEALLSKRVISETEEAIRSRLKPLLDRAEVRNTVNCTLSSVHVLFTHAKRSPAVPNYFEIEGNLSIIVFQG